MRYPAPPIRRGFCQHSRQTPFWRNLVAYWPSGAPEPAKRRPVILRKLLAAVSAARMLTDPRVACCSEERASSFLASRKVSVPLHCGRWISVLQRSAPDRSCHLRVRNAPLMKTFAPFACLCCWVSDNRRRTSLGQKECDSASASPLHSHPSHIRRPWAARRLRLAPLPCRSRCHRPS